MRLDPALLRAAVGCTADLAEIYADHLTDACELYDIRGPVRMSAFLAQVGHESGSFKHTAEVWGPTDAQKRYEGRKDLGNVQIGDGYFFRGRGLLQVTGRDNVAKMAETLGLPLLQSPELLEQPRWAALSAAAWWHAHGCNQLADRGDFELLTRRINGGINGLEDRLKRWERAKTALAATQATTPAPAPETRQEYPIPPVDAYTAPRPDQEPYTQPEPTMALPAITAIPAVLSWALPILAEAVPRLGKMFGSGSAVSERNLAATTIALDVAKKAIGAANEQELVERIKSDPSAAQAVRDAVDLNWAKIHEAHEASIGAARQFVAAQPQRVVIANMVFHEVLALVMILISAAGAITALFATTLGNDTKTAIVMLMLVGGWTGVKEFYFGGSRGSDRKTEIINERQQQ